MKKIDITEWKEFEIKELFTINPTKYHRLTNKDLMQDDGENPVIVNSSFNNGIGGYTNYELTEKGNVITFSDTTTSDSIFYQPNDFVGYSHVQVVKPISNIEKWNRYSLLFFTAIFKKKASLMNYDYVNKFTRADALKIKVKLPIDTNGELNWEYMESFIKRLETRERESTSNLTSYLNNVKLNKVDTSKWKEFDVMDLFSPKAVKNKVVIYDKKNFGITPVYASESSYKNNIGYIDDEPEFYVNDEQSMYVIFGDHTKSMRIIETNFSVTDNVKVLSPKIQSKNSLFFVMTSWLANIPDLGYSRHWSIAKKTKIKLPVKSDNTPDWDYMERYIENLKLKCNIANYNI